MKRLERLINILKLTPHRQPELVREASIRILSRFIRNDSRVATSIKPLIDILIQYCDNDDSGQRSIFNDHLNCVIVAFQHQYYQSILQILLEVVTTNGSARTVTAALQRIPHLIENVQPIELGCEPQTFFKALIEVARRADDESILKTLEHTLKSVMPYLSCYIRKSKELLSNSLIDILLKNLQHESSQTKRLAAASLATICLNSHLLMQNVISKLEAQLETLLNNPDDLPITEKFVGFCLCVREIPEFAEKQHISIIKMILNRIQSNPQDSPAMISALETMKELFKFPIERSKIDQCVKVITEEFLLSKSDSKVILLSNALACIAALLRQRPNVIDKLDSIFEFSHHPDVAVRNQVVIIIGNYIESSWRFPNCIDKPVQCDKMCKLWIMLRDILKHKETHPDTLKSCAISIKTCLHTLLESDHCTHIIENSDFDLLVNLYLQSNFNPFRIEILSLFSNLNYRTVHYLERCHWAEAKSHLPGSLLLGIQDKILNKVIMPSLIDEHARVRVAASAALISIIPNLYLNNSENSQSKSSDPMVSLAQELADEHLIVLEQANENVSSNFQDRIPLRESHALLSSSLVRTCNSQNLSAGGHPKSNISINLKYVVGLLKTSIENSLDKGKMSISAIVKTLHELSLHYPVYKYPAAWDCRPSEYCDCFALLNFILSYLENLNEPDIVVEDLESYRNFLLLSHQLIYALCHESVLAEYENQKLKTLHKRQEETRDGYWSELTLKHQCIESFLEIYFIHLIKLLGLMAFIIDEQNNPFETSSKHTSLNQQKLKNQESLISHGALISNRSLFSRVYKKLESSYRSSKKNLNQRAEKFHQILETCLAGISSLLEFIGMNKSHENVQSILNHLKITSKTCGVHSLICARQLLKSLFGINILALYQLDPNDWFEDDLWSCNAPSILPTANQPQDSPVTAPDGVYHELISHPYKVFSSYYSRNRSLTPTSDRALAALNFESRRSLKVRRRIEDRVKFLFEYHPNQLISPKVRQISELLKSTIVEFTPIVTNCMNQFSQNGFCSYQSEVLHFMSYLILLRVNYQKLAMANDFISSVNNLLDQFAEKTFRYREKDTELFLQTSFTFLTLLSYERGPSQPMFQVADLIQMLDEIRAKLSIVSSSDEDVITYVVPLLRCLVEDLFIYRTKNFHGAVGSIPNNRITNLRIDSEKDTFEIIEAERETVAQKLLDVIDNPKVYDLLSILILESRQNSDGIKYKKLSQHLLSIIPTKLTDRRVNLVDYSCVESTSKIIENISPEVFQPVNFIFETLLGAPKPQAGLKSKEEFQRWMSLVIIAMHILINQVKEEVFLNRLRENMSEEIFVEDLLHIAQICTAEILLRLFSPSFNSNHSETLFLTQLLSSYILYLSHMFQSGAFFQLSISAGELVRRKTQEGSNAQKLFRKLCVWARDPDNEFSMHACEKMFFHIRLFLPDLTIYWCNLMMLFNSVDCNRDFWRNLLVYGCSSCQPAEDLARSIQDLSLMPQPNKSIKFTRNVYINRPSSLNLTNVNFSDQLRRSFIKKITANEFNDKFDCGKQIDCDLAISTGQCLAPNIELTRRGTLCLVLDFVTISMNDVEHITWLIIHYISDIIRWSHELPITEFINAVHGNSASSGIFIQAINSVMVTSIASVARLLCTLQNVHYTQYGSLVVLLVEKLLSSPQLMPYRSLTKNIEEFACSTVQKLLNETNKSLVTTNDEVVNQLTADDLDRISSMLDPDLYPYLTKLLTELRDKSNETLVSDDKGKFITE